MENIKDAKVSVKRLSQNDGFHYYYGYYDNPAFCANDKKHLCHKVKFWDRLPNISDTAELGIINIETGGWEKIAETGAFNFQQGSMLQWNPKNPETEVIYNVREGDEYRAVIHNIESGKIITLPAAVANVSQDGKWGLAVNMNRLFDFRPGYGYSDVRDSWYDTPQPKDDGIWVVDIEKGEQKLILNYSEMGWLFSIDQSDKLIVNHLTFSPDNNRLMFLVRTFSKPGRSWQTGLGTIDRDGSKFYLMNPVSMASHYNWLNNEQLLVWATVKGQTGMFLFTDKKEETVFYDNEFFPKDVHCIYSPDRKIVLGDGGVDEEGYRPIYLYNMETKKRSLILRAKSAPIATGDIRSDLHNRWSRNGSLVSFDSTHEGFRALYLIDLSELITQL